MVAPWDAHRSQLPGWNSDDEVVGGRETFDDPPPPTNLDEFSTPDYKVDQTEFDLPSDTTSNHLGNASGFIFVISLSTSPRSNPADLLKVPSTDDIC